MPHLSARSCAGRIALAAVLVLVAAPAALAQAWRTYRYPADGFSAAFPVEPEVSSHQAPGSGGSAIEFRSYVAAQGSATTFVGVSDYAAAAAARNPDQVLADARDGALANVRARLLGEKTISLGLYPGLEFEGENAALHFSARIYFVGTTLYQTLVISPVGAPYADALRFLDSFGLIARERK